ncbi:MAG: LPXTG cell wall anchor domain-containing protein [Lachnospiraceae bacterium]|jgi:LPXTG-motif cell wall-anchored protein|nr:LPXTG cell wall anchor domain-containing protein [Lachnospiraceae bacterium]
MELKGTPININTISNATVISGQHGVFSITANPNNQGTATISELALGDYLITELDADNEQVSYHINGETSQTHGKTAAVSVTASNDPEVTFTDYPKAPEIRIYKLGDKDGLFGLAGTKFSISHDAVNGVINWEGTTNELGDMLVPNLPKHPDFEGDYYLKEVSVADSHYEKLAGEIIIKVKGDGTVESVTPIDEKDKELVAVSGIGTNIVSITVTNHYNENPEKPQEPDNPKPDNPKPDNPKPDSPKPDAPKDNNPPVQTGDDANILLWIGLLTTAVVVLVAVVLVKRKRKKDS